MPFLAESEEAEQFIAEHSEEPASDVVPGAHCEHCSDRAGA